MTRRLRLRSIMAVCVMPYEACLYCVDGNRIVWDSRGNGADTGEIWIKENNSDCEWERLREHVRRAKAILGSVQNYRAIETFQRDYAY